MSKWKIKNLQKKNSNKKSLRQKYNDNKKFNLNPIARIKAKKEEEKQKEIDREVQLRRKAHEKKKEEERLAQLETQKKKRKIIEVVIGFFVLIFSIILWPVLLPLSLLGLWYFTKKNPNDKFKRYAKNLTIINALGLVIMFVIPESENSHDIINDADTAVLVEDVAAVEDQITEDEMRRELFAESQKRKEELKKEKEQKREERIQEERRKEKELAEANPNKTDETEAPKEPVQIPEGQEDVNVNDNIPLFSNEDITSTEAYHRNGPLDSLGRVTAANAVLGVEIMPAHERGNPTFEPTGWNQRRYAGIGAGGWLYNRSHLIGFQLSGNDDYANLMTGTRWFNMRMLEYENFVANYVESTENHVRYRVTPVFEGNNMVASGAYMEGFSIEDNGEGLMFNVYIPNVQPGVEINYADGSSIGPEGPAQEGEISQYNPPKSSSGSSSGNSGQSSTPAPAPAPEPKPAPAPTPEPAPSQPQVGDISSIDTNGNGTVTIQEAKDAGFTMPIKSDHWLYQYMIDRDGDGMVGE